MRKILKALKWTGIVLLSILLILTVVVAMRQDLKYEAPYPNIAASKDSAIIARGKEIVTGPAHCISCHGPSNAEELLKKDMPIALSGGYEFKLPFGSFYARNITPDDETGIGKLTDKEIARLLRYGVKADGNAVLDFMPFHDMSDEDLTAVISYLRAQKPVNNKVPEHNINPMGKVIKAFLIKPVGPSSEIVKSINRDTSAAYGKYLAMNVANCNGCHTKRDMTGKYIGEPFAGGVEFEEEGKPTLITPNISGDANSRLAGWKEEDFIKRFRMGKVIDYTHMPWTSFSKMSDNDLKAIYRYLKSVRGSQNSTAVVSK